MDKTQLMKEKIEILNNAAKAYYQENREIMPNAEYDRLYDELLDIEKETGQILSNSPTQYVGYELLSDLPKERHEKPMLSLDKTKSMEDLKDWIGSEKGILSWKLDGLTIVLTYLDGKLAKAVTRGNGEIGEVITNNARVFANIPVAIPYKEDLILRGEAVIRYSDFEKINSEIPDLAAKYKNPRNLCSGSVRQLNNKITAERNVNFFAFALVKADNVDFHNSRMEQLKWLSSQGFDAVEFIKVDSSDILKTIGWFAENVAKNDFPSDGLVLSYDDIHYGESLGKTSKFPRDSIAFKWRDEVKETTLLEIEWSASRTGLINPIAIFEPVELEGTTVSRASVHNISILENLKLGIGDTIGVYKANMIIPQILENFTKSGNVHIPENCPVCLEKAEIKQDNGVKFLFCGNSECLAKQIKLFTHFVSRDAMGVDGLSEATIEKLIAKGLIKELADIFHVSKYKAAILEMEGFGEKSFNNLLSAVEEARKTNVIRLLYSLGIPNIGLSNAKTICKEFKYEWESIQHASYEQLVEIPGIGQIVADGYLKYFANEKNKIIIDDIIDEIEFEEIEETSGDLLFDGITFVITGSLEIFNNRNELKNILENKGGKVTDTVTSKTNYLINNDNLSSSSKNKKAKELGILIVKESQISEWINTGATPLL